MAVEAVVLAVEVGSADWVAAGGLREAEAGERSLVLVRGVGGGGGIIVVLTLGLLARLSSSSSAVPSIGEGGTTRHSW